MPFRQSPFIDFDSGTVKVPPMTLIRNLGLRADQPLETMLAVFECRVDVWQFGPAVEMLKLMDASKDQHAVWSHAGYALLAVTVSYFEMVGKILNPAASPIRGKDDFNTGFCDVYPAFTSSPAVDGFRDRLRNGMYHLGYTKSHLYIHNAPHEFPEDFTTAVQDGELYYFVNPHAMTRTIVDHFPTLMSRLRDRSGQYSAMQESFRRFYVDFHSAPSSRLP